MLRSPCFWVIGLLGLSAVSSGCGPVEVVLPPGSGGGGSGTGAGHEGGTGGSGAGFGGFEMGGGTTTSTAGNPCDGVACDVDQHCEAQEGAGVCVNNTCEELMCSDTEVCEMGPNGGFFCKDISCATDLDCAVSDFCNGTICVADLCPAGELTCSGDDVLVCAPNGSGTSVKLVCGSDAYFTSVCSEDGMGKASCGCEDDWDCPPFTVCEVGECVGTGKAPTCSLPPPAFANVLPVKEIQWGGTGAANKNAVGAPFPASSQACETPLVVNLDDDNGDGLINELDFPEILFMTYCASDVATNGIVRAIHGGGPNKGKDMFATCGATVWHEGDDLAMACPCANATGNSTGALAAGDLDNDGIPEIVVPTETAGLVILNNQGVQIAATAANQWANYINPAPAIANLDNQGYAEIVVGRYVFTLGDDAGGNLAFVDKFGGSLMEGKQGQGPVPCVANVAGDERQEIVAGTTVYRLPSPPPGVTKIAECVPPYMDPEHTAFCNGQLLVVWDGQTVNGAAAIPNAQRDGFCAVADVLGVDPAIAPSPTNPLDQKPEVVLINEGTLLVLSGEDGTLRRFIALGLGTDGGAPNVDDFDGDGFPEIGSAFGTRYIVMDLQDPTAACPAWPNAFSDAGMGLQGNPARSPGGACTMDAECAAGAVCNKILGACVCLHNAWQRVTEDDSSRVTSSSVFDFNGDGAAEVVYNDECFYRIYDGVTADVLFKQPSPSRTRIENPVIADVDNDGNAEIVFPSNNEVALCSGSIDYPNGIAVWGDASDSWVSARRIWNEHAYHVTNVTEAGGIPLKEPESWKPYNGRVYNTYRSNPRSYGVAPDLVVSAVQVSSPDATCGELSNLLTITAKIDNAGDLRVGPGVVVTFYGIWGGVEEALYADAMMTPLTTTILSSLEPGSSLLVSVPYDAQFNAAGVIPDEVKVVADEANAEKECNEDNNMLTKVVEPTMQLADLTITLGVVNENACPSPEVITTVANAGSAPASNILVRYYAGDPSAGGTPIHEETIAGPLDGGMTVTFTASLDNFPNDLSILVYGIVDPENAIEECNDGNNKDAADNKVECGQLN